MELAADLKAWIQAYTAGDIFVSGAVTINYDFKEDLENTEGIEHAAPLRFIEMSWLYELQRRRCYQPSITNNKQII